MMAISASIVVVIAAILVGTGYLWGRDNGVKAGKIDGRAEGFRSHEDLVFGRIHQHYPEQAQDMIHHLLV